MRGKIKTNLLWSKKAKQKTKNQKNEIAKVTERSHRNVEKCKYNLSKYRKTKQILRQKMQKNLPRFWEDKR